MLKTNHKQDEIRDEQIKKIIDYFLNVRDEKIGVIAAGEILYFFMEMIGKDIYSKAVTDSKKLLMNRMEDLEVEFDILIAQK